MGVSTYPLSAQQRPVERVGPSCARGSRLWLEALLDSCRRG